MTSRPGLFGSVVSLSAKPKRLEAALVNPPLLPLLSFAQTGIVAPCTSSALATMPQASRMQ